MIVCYAATKNLYPYLKAAIGSLLKYNDPEKVYVLCEDDNIDGLPEIVEPVNVSGQTYYRPDGPNMNSIFTYMSMMRLLYVDLFPDLDKILQLDVDTVVCDDLSPIWNMDLTGRWFAACPEYKGNYKPFGDYIRYYNVGVMVVNLDQMRKDGKVPEMVELLNRRRYWCTEQDVLNLYAVEQGLTKDIPVRFNETAFTGKTDDPAVIHYAGFPKWYQADPRMDRVEYLIEARKAVGEI